MQLALIDNIRVPAAPTLKGLCPGCMQPVTSICGEQRIWHWRHITKEVCDRWWETETEWHRNWKNKFPLEWQECIKYEPQSGEKHIADICTNQGLIIEFQHSYLKPQERIARENFYKNMVWVVDGTRLEKDYSRLIKGMEHKVQISAVGHYLVLFPEKCFPANWLESTAPIFFDFFDTEQTTQQVVTKEVLWCLFPGRVEGKAMVLAISRQNFMTIATGGTDYTFQNLLADTSKLANDFATQSRRNQANQLTANRYHHRPTRRTRRF